jgi:hypothetical protein
MYNFVTGFDLQEMYLTHVHDINSQSVGQIIHVHGAVVNCNFDHIYYHVAINSTSVAILLESKLYGASSVQSEGLEFNDNIIFGAQTLVWIKSGYYIQVKNNILDGATGTAIIIDDVYNMDFTGNFIATSGPAFLSLNTSSNSLPSMGHFSNNYLAGGASQTGIIFNAGGNARFGAHIDGNDFTNIDHPISIQHSPFNSTFIGNIFNAGGTAPDISVTDSSNTHGVFIRDNSSNGTELVFTYPTGVVGYIQGNNCNQSGCQGPQAKIQPIGCTTAASVGAACSGTITWPTAFPDTNYTAVCTEESSTGLPVITNIGKAAGSLTVAIAAITAVAATTTLNCIATPN